MVDPAVSPLAELDCRDQEIAYQPQGLKSQTAWALAEILLCSCRHLVTTLYLGQTVLLRYPGHGSGPPHIGYHMEAGQ